MKYLVSLLAMSLMSFQAFSFVVGKVDVQNVLVSVKEGKKVRDQLKDEFEKKRKIDSEQEKLKITAKLFQAKSMMNDKAA